MFEEIDEHRLKLKYGSVDAVIRKEEPALVLNRWGGECFLSLRLRAGGKFTPRVVGPSYEWVNDKLEAHVYAKKGKLKHWGEPKVPIASDTVRIEEISGILYLFINDVSWTKYIPNPALEDEVYRKECIEQENKLKKASGKVLVGGLGFGIASSFLLQNPNISSVTTIELFRDVIETVKKINPTLVNPKHTIIEGDFCDYCRTTDEKFDFVYTDITGGSPPWFERYEEIKQVASKVLTPNGIFDCAHKEFLENPEETMEKYSQDIPALEFELVLKHPPLTNKIVFDIKTRELEFYFQPPLSPEEKAIRPDKVIGSYAVYHASRGNVHRSRKTAEKYQTGKAFHIYRPKTRDSSGKEAWCDLHIDENVGILTVTIPQEFLDKAVYPIVVDPTFGFTTAGGSSIAMNDRIAGSWFTIPDAGIPQSISAYIYSYHTCFTGYTKITMADGSYKEAKDVSVEDKVAYYDFNEGRVKTTTVTRVNEHSADEMGPYYLAINDILKVTSNHPLDKLDGSVVIAGKVGVGDFLQGEKGTIKVFSIEKVWRKVKTYSLETESGHYFIDGFSDCTKPFSLSGTSKILVSEGKRKQLKEFKIGDSIVTYNLQTRKNEVGKVTRARFGGKKEILIINNKLELTAFHKVYTNEGWKGAEGLEIGDKLLNEMGEFVGVTSIKSGGVKEVGSLDTSPNHNFFASGFLVHNEDGYGKCAIYDKSDDSKVGETVQLTFSEYASSTTAWRTFNITSSDNLVANTDYYLNSWGDVGALAGLNIYYDTVTAKGGYQNRAYGTWPDPWSPTPENKKYSIYCTYSLILPFTAGTKVTDLISLGWKGEERAEAKATDLLASRVEIYQSHIAEVRATDLITSTQIFRLSQIAEARAEAPPAYGWGFEQFAEALADELMSPGQILHLPITAEARATDAITPHQLLHIYKLTEVTATDVFFLAQILHVYPTAEGRARAILEPLEWIVPLLAEARATDIALPLQAYRLYPTAEARAEAPPAYGLGFEQIAEAKVDSLLEPLGWRIPMLAEAKATESVGVGLLLKILAGAKATDLVTPSQLLHLYLPAGAKATDLVSLTQALHIYKTADAKATDVFFLAQILHVYPAAEARAKDVLEPLEWIVPLLTEARAADLVTPRQVLHLYLPTETKVDSLLEPLGWLAFLRAEARAEELIALRQVLHVPIATEAKATDLVSPSQLLHLYPLAGARAADLVAPGQLLHIYKTAGAKATDLFSLAQLLCLYPVAEAKARDVLEPLGWVVPLLAEVRATDIALPLQALLLYPTAEARAEAPPAYGWGFEQIAEAKATELAVPRQVLRMTIAAAAKATDLVSPAQLLHFYLPAVAKATDLVTPSQLLHISKLADIVSSAPLALSQVLHVPVLAEVRAADLFSLGFVVPLTAAVKASAPVTLRQLLRAYLIATAKADAAKTGKRKHPDRYMPTICLWYFDIDTGEVLPETFD